VSVPIFFDFFLIFFWIFFKKSKNCHVSSCHRATWQWQWHVSVLCQVSFS